MKWFNQLTKEEVLSFQKTYDKKIADKIDIKYYPKANYADVYFYEYGWKNHEKEALPTRYHFEDFNAEFDEVYTDKEERFKLKQNYILFMANRFGKEYIIDLLEKLTGIPTKNWEKIFNK